MRSDVRRKLNRNLEKLVALYAIVQGNCDGESRISINCCQHARALVGAESRNEISLSKYRVRTVGRDRQFGMQVINELTTPTWVPDVARRRPAPQRSAAWLGRDPGLGWGAITPFPRARRFVFSHGSRHVIAAMATRRAHSERATL
ncbi:unnamed protein product, partial [Iphiclides podalirius]